MLSVAEVAKRLGISRTHAYDLIQAGKLPAYRHGRTLTVAEADLETYLERARVVPVRPAEEPVAPRPARPARAAASTTAAPPWKRMFGLR